MESVKETCDWCHNKVVGIAEFGDDRRKLCGGCLGSHKEDEWTITMIEPKQEKQTKNEILHQAWLKAACELFRQNFFEFPEVVATYGFPAPNSGDVRGACHHPEDDGGKDRRPVIIIHPAEWNNPIEVLTVLLHEAIHAKLGKPITQEEKSNSGHGVEFQKYANSVGLEIEGAYYGKRSKKLEEQLNEALKLLPEMPKDPLGRGEVKRQKGRMKLFQCTCGFKIRCGKDSLLAECKRCFTAFEMKKEE